MHKNLNKIKFRSPLVDGEASGWGVLALVIVVLIVCVT
jgi:hypothetical protein